MWPPPKFEWFYNFFCLLEDSEDLEEDQEEDGDEIKEDREDLEEEIEDIEEDKEDAEASDDIEGAVENDEKEIENPYITLHTKKRKLDSQGLFCTFCVIFCCCYCQNCYFVS